MRALLLAGFLGAASLALTGCDTYDTVEYRDGYGHYGHSRTDVVIHDDRDRGYYRRGYRDRDYRRVNVYDRDYDRRREVNRVVVNNDRRTSTVNRVVVRNDNRDRRNVVVRGNDRDRRNVNRTVVRGNDSTRDPNFRRVTARNNERGRDARRPNVTAPNRGDRDGRRGDDNDDRRRGARTVL